MCFVYRWEYCILIKEFAKEIGCVARGRTLQTLPFHCHVQCVFVCRGVCVWVCIYGIYHQNRFCKSNRINVFNCKFNENEIYMYINILFLMSNVFNALNNRKKISSSLVHFLFLIQLKITPFYTIFFSILLGFLFFVFHIEQIFKWNSNKNKKKFKLNFCSSHFGKLIKLCFFVWFWIEC